MIKYYLNDDSKYTGIIKRSSIGIGATIEMRIRLYFYTI